MDKYPNLQLNLAGWQKKSQYMQLEKCSKTRTDAGIDYFIPYKEVKFSNILPSSVAVSLTDQNCDLGLKLPSSITK